MTSLARIVIASLLCLLLPLQAGAVVVRSVVMSAQHAAHTSAKPLQLAHAIGAPHQHGAHATQDKSPHKKSAKPAKARSMQQAKAECHDGAKCCLVAASAPPPANGPCFYPAIARLAYTPLSLPPVAFLTDGPERPPRTLCA